MRFLTRESRAPEAVAHGSESVPPWPQQAEVIRLLLIDDDEDDFALLRSTLSDIRDTRFELDWVPSYGEGLHRVRQGGYHAYLIDYRLGAFTGVELVREARAAGAHDPLIMLTGEGSRMVDMEAMGAGATDFLQKGRTPPDLLERTIRYAITHTATTEALRRTLRQVSGLEAFGRLLSEKGPTPEVLDAVMQLLVEDFGVTHASIYLMDGDVLRQAAVLGYPASTDFLDPRVGRVARVIDSGRAQTIPNITVDPDYRAGDTPMELCLPFMAERTCLGILNVAWSGESTASEVQQGVHVIADRLAVGLALNRAIGGKSFVASPSSRIPS